jgi:hypothetical protein
MLEVFIDRARKLGEGAVVGEDRVEGIAPNPDRCATKSERRGLMMADC